MLSPAAFPSDDDPGYSIAKRSGRDIVETGLLLTQWPVTVAIMGIIAGRLSDRYPAGVLGSAGLALPAAGFVAIIALPQNADAGAIVWRLALCGLGFGLFESPNMRALMTSARQPAAGERVASSQWPACPVRLRARHSQH